MPDASGKKDARCGFGYQSKVYERRDQLGRLGQEDKITVQQHGRSDADSVALNGRNQRLGRLAEISDEAERFG